MLAGIAFGVGAALMQAVSYLLSAFFIKRYQTSAAKHLILVHIVIGFVSLLILPMVWHPHATQLNSYVLPLISAACSYMFGQYSLYQAIHHSAASRVSPLLGLKIIVLALIGALYFGESYHALQWGAVLLCVIGAIWLSASGGTISGPALLWVIAACCGYAISDLSVLKLMQYFSALPLTQAAILSVSLCYLLCGSICLLFWPRIKSYSQLIASTPAALSWLIAMFFLFACFSEIGVVFGGIVQSSRGLISILLAIILALIGMSFADPIPKTRVLVQRIIAAILMMCAIVLFSLGDGSYT